MKLVKKVFKIYEKQIKTIRQKNYKVNCGALNGLLDTKQGF